jgi:hypothetical protein
VLEASLSRRFTYFDGSKVVNDKIIYSNPWLPLWTGENGYNFKSSKPLIIKTNNSAGYQSIEI